MHGFPDNVHLYDRLSPYLSPPRRVVLFDFLGWGSSDKPSGYPYTTDNQVGDLDAVITQLELGQVVLVAHDASGPPLWRELPQMAFWFLPAMIGTPIILLVLRRHPLVIAYDRAGRNFKLRHLTHPMKTADSGEEGRGWGIVAAGVFAIVAGFGEIIVGVTGNYLGILSKPLESSAVTALVGACYALGGVFILTSKKWGAALGTALIAAEILGRIYLVAAGVAPSSGPDAIKIAVGAAIALALIGYVASQWRRFH